MGVKMKKFMLLGLLIMMGLSFAQPENWMQPAQGRYYCDVMYSAALTDYAHDSLGATEDQFSQMFDLVASEGGMAGNVGAMYVYADCNDIGQYPSQFRAEMASYNTDSAAFKRIFNTVLRNYLTAHPTERSTIFSQLALYAQDRRDCITQEPDGAYCLGAEEEDT
jgi:hypothetical protein